jgi:hypothetical protein
MARRTTVKMPMTWGGLCGGGARGTCVGVAPEGWRAGGRRRFDPGSREEGDGGGAAPFWIDDVVKMPTTWGGLYGGGARGTCVGVAPEGWRAGDRGRFDLGSREEGDGDGATPVWIGGAALFGPAEMTGRQMG